MSRTEKDAPVSGRAQGSRTGTSRRSTARQPGELITLKHIGGYDQALCDAWLSGLQ